MAAGDKAGGDAATAAPLLVSAAAGRRRRCPGCRTKERCEAHPGIPYLNFFYIWIVCLCAFPHLSFLSLCSPETD
uniref:Uncharacterized protein n=1 Tax=Oryza meridionalis TaxID=40149 RepID=A0A0E0C0T5_9ORYZ